jgi:hypothetical protein
MCISSRIFLASDLVGLRWRGKDLFEAGQLHIVDVQQLVSALLDHPIEGSRPATQSLHRHHHGKLQPLFEDRYATEESLEAFLVVRDLELLEHSSVCTSDPDPMLLRSDVQGNAQLRHTHR